MNTLWWHLMNDNYVPCLLCKSDSHTEVESHFGDPYRASNSITRTVICNQCGLIYSNPQPGLEQLEQLYSGSYGGQRTNVPDRFYISRKDYDASLRIDFIKRVLPSLKPGRALEIGAGAGNQLYALKSLGWDVEGVEPTPGYASFAREKFEVEVIEGYFDKNIYEPESFDLIIMAEVLEHFPDPVDLLNSLHGILKPEGYIYIDVPNVLRPNRFRLKEYLHGDHLTFFSPKTFKLAIEFSGYSIVEHKWHYYQYALLEKSKSKKQIDFGIEGDNPLEVLKVLKRPRFYLAATFIKRSARNLIIRLLGPSLGAKSLRKGAHLRNFFRGW